MKIFLMSLCLMVLSQVFGQQITYTLKRSTNQLPVSGLKVELFKTGKVTELVGTGVTDLNGQVVFDSLSKGGYLLKYDDSIWTCSQRYVNVGKKKSIQETDWVDYSTRKKMRDLGDYVISEQAFKRLMEEAKGEERVLTDVMSIEEKEKYRHYLAEQIKYPQIAVELGLEGNVYLMILTDETNTIQHIAISKSVDPEIDYEAIRVLDQLHRFDMRPQAEKGLYFYLAVVVFRLM